MIIETRKKRLKGKLHIGLFIGWFIFISYRTPPSVITHPSLWKISGFLVWTILFMVLHLLSHQVLEWLSHVQQVCVVGLINPHIASEVLHGGSILLGLESSGQLLHELGLLALFLEVWQVFQQLLSKHFLVQHQVVLWVLVLGVQGLQALEICWVVATIGCQLSDLFKDQILHFLFVRNFNLARWLERVVLVLVKMI